MVYLAVAGAGYSAFAGINKRRPEFFISIVPNGTIPTLYFVASLYRCCREHGFSSASESAWTDFPVENAYKLLGVSETSSFDEIKASFRKLAKETHPDLAESKNDSTASRRFVQILAAYEILSDSQKRAHYDMYLLSQKKLMQRHSGQGSKLQIYKSRATAFKEMEVVEWLKWYRLTINNILAEKKVVVGTGYFDVLERDFYSAIHAAYYGPEIDSMELLPDCFEAEERSSYETPEILHLVSGRDLFGMVCLANKVPEISITNNEKLTSFRSFHSGLCQSITYLNVHRNAERSDDFETHQVVKQDHPLGGFCFKVYLYKNTMTRSVISMYRKEDSLSLLKDLEHPEAGDDNWDKNEKTLTLKWHKVLWDLQDLDKKWLLLKKQKRLDIGGEMNLAAGIQVAQLALKHRQNKKQQQRIIVFAGSPVKHEKKMLEMIGRKLKKNSVALDIVNFGEEDEGKTEKLEALLAAVNNNDTSHIVHVPSGPNALSDVLISTPIFTGDGEGGSGFAAAAATAAAGGISGFEFGVDPNLDPELALALRVSMEEERARQEAAAKKAAEDAANQEKGGEQQASSQHATMTERAGAATSEAENKTSDLMDDENALLQQALAMSMDDSAISHDVKDTDMSEASASDPDLALALQLSITDSAKDQSSQSDMSKLLADQSFVSSILASLPGVDPNDPSVKDLLASMQNQSEPQQKNDDKPSNEEEKK